MFSYYMTLNMPETSTSKLWLSCQTYFSALVVGGSGVHKQLFNLTCRSFRLTSQFFFFFFFKAIFIHTPTTSVSWIQFLQIIKKEKIYLFEFQFSKLNKSNRMHKLRGNTKRLSQVTSLRYITFCFHSNKSGYGTVKEWIYRNTKP